MGWKQQDPMFSEEIKLLERCLAKEKKAWGAFVEKYERLISHAIIQTLKKYSVSSPNQDVPDLFHTVFLSLIDDNFRKLRQFQGKCKLSTFLHMIAVRMTIDYLRQQSEHLSLNGETAEEISLEMAMADGNPLPDSLIELREEEQIFQEIMKTLTTKERFFVELCYIRELPPAKIAGILNTTENNVYQLKSRIREKMKEIAGNLL